MARFVVCGILLHLGFLCKILNASESHEDHVHTTTSQKAAYQSPVPIGFAHLAEHFDKEEDFKTKWIVSKAKKDDTEEDIAKYDGTWAIEQPQLFAQEGDYGLVLKSKARHAAICSRLSKPFYFEDKPLIVQYEVTFQEGQECGGAYLKLLSLDPENEDLENFRDKNPYTIMFGPDKCGNNQKLHFIFRHKNPLNGSMEEKHAKQPGDKLDDYFKDKQSHLYTLIVQPDNSFLIKIDGKVVNGGTLLDDFTPPVNPPLEIEDPNDVRPEDWDDREKIPDPSAVKPDDWDEDAPAQIVDESDIMPDGWLENEPPMIPNPDAVKPDDWENDMDGEWEPPEIPNPKCADVPGCGPYKQRMMKNPRYKGKWLPPLVNNPDYKGKWKPRLIHNPDYFNDDNPFRMTPIIALGFELWSMSPNIMFDNIIITDDEEVAKRWAVATFSARRRKIAADGETLWGRMMRAMNYKPGWWALYFIYCTIPVTLYIWYLLRQLRKWNAWRQIAVFTADHPWMWAVYIIAAGIPILLLLYCCCFSSNEDKEEEDLKDNEYKEPLISNSEDFVEEQMQDNDEAVTKDEDEKPEKTVEIEELIDSGKSEESPAEDGPRRRKLNKE